MHGIIENSIEYMFHGNLNELFMQTNIKIARLLEF